MDRRTSSSRAERQAECQRLYRQRQRRGIAMVRVAVPPEVVEGLLAAGRLDDVGNRDAARVSAELDVGVQADNCDSLFSDGHRDSVRSSHSQFLNSRTSLAQPENPYRDLFEEDLQPVNGRLAVPTKPGFGMTLRKDAEKRREIAAVTP